MAMLEIKDMTMRFGGLVAVDKLNLEVKEGELVSLIGSNGAGKTTVFNVLTGLYPSAAGNISFGGENITGKSPQQVVRAGIARTFQNLRFFPNMRVIENVLLGNHI